MDKNYKAHCLLALSIFLVLLSGWIVESGLRSRISNLESVVSEQAKQAKGVHDALYGQIGPVMRKIVVDLYGTEVISATESVRVK